MLATPDSTTGEDGVLFLGEIYNLRLDADLVTLSACETGLGKISRGEGIIGLTRALLYAGARNVMVSLWKVADASTGDLMVNFYTNILEARKNTRISAAMREAKLSMIKDQKYANPYYWSPFIMVGR
jgi:CHAT domain-containing protein